jgi:hypothetical protein
MLLPWPLLLILLLALLLPHRRYPAADHAAPKCRSLSYLVGESLLLQALLLLPVPLLQVLAQLLQLDLQANLEQRAPLMM